MLAPTFGFSSSRERGVSGAQLQRQQLRGKKLPLQLHELQHESCPLDQPAWQPLVWPAQCACSQPKPLYAAALLDCKFMAGKSL